MEDSRLSKLKKIINTVSTDEEKIEEIKKILSDSINHETLFIEYKERIPQNKRLWKHIAAFSFEGEGAILMGVSDDQKIVGIKKSEFIDEWDKMLRKESDGEIGVWNWEENLKLNDIIEIKSLKVNAEEDLYLYIIFIRSKTSIVWTDEKSKYWYRGHDQTLQISDLTLLSKKISEKSGMNEKREKTQEILNSVANLVYINYIEYNLNQPNSGSNKYNVDKARKKYIELIPMESNSDFRYNGSQLMITLGDFDYTIPLRNPFSYDNYKESRGKIIKTKQGEIMDQNNQKHFVTSIDDIREIFRLWARKLSQKYNFRIDFDESILPTENDILIRFFDKLKVAANSDGNEIIKVLNDWNLKYLKILSLLSKKVEIQIDERNNHYSFKSIKFGGKTITLNNNKLFIQSEISDFGIFDEIKSELSDKTQDK